MLAVAWGKKIGRLKFYEKGFPITGSIRKGTAFFATLISIFHAETCAADVQVQEILQETRFFAGASFGVSEFEFPEKLDHNIYFPMGQLLLGSTYKKFQLSVSTARSLDDAEVAEEELIGDSSRDEYDITFGYALTPKVTLIIGYKDTETEIAYEPRDTDLLLQETDESYQQDGYYVGVNYTWRFERAGNLTASIAHADLKADNVIVSDREVPIDPNGPPPADGDQIDLDDFGRSIKGDSTGYSVGLTWTMPLAGHVLYQAQLKINDYRQDLKIGQYTFNDVNTLYATLAMGLTYVF